MAGFDAQPPIRPRMTFRRRTLPLFFICIAAGVIFLGAPAALIEAQSGLRGFSAAHVDAERQLEQSLRKIPDAQHAEENLKRITAEPHMAGTEASHRLAEWLRLQYESFGFDAKLVSYSVWLPQPTEIKLELICSAAQIARHAGRALRVGQEYFRCARVGGIQYLFGFGRCYCADRLCELWDC